MSDRPMEACPAAPRFRAVRRRDRAMEDEGWIRDLLSRAPVGVLGTADGGQPLLNPNLFAFDGETDTLYLHTARVGATREAIERNPAVCFTVYEMGRLLPADEALEFSVEFASVIAIGRARVVADRGEARVALQRILDKYAPHLRPGTDYRPITDAELARTAVYRVDIESWSGKRKEEGSFPGAYRWPPPSVATRVSREAFDGPGESRDSLPNLPGAQGGVSE